MFDTIMKCAEVVMAFLSMIMMYVKLFTEPELGKGIFWGFMMMFWCMMLIRRAAENGRNDKN